MNLTIGIPTYNAEKELPQFLKALRQNTAGLQSFLDVVFVDGESTDKTPKMLKKFQRKYQDYHRCTIESLEREAPDVNVGIHEKNGICCIVPRVQNIANARNRIVELSPRHNDILFLDDDVIPEDFDSIKKLIVYAQIFKTDITGGIYPLLFRHPFEIASSAFYYNQQKKNYLPLSIPINSTKSLIPWKTCKVNSVGFGFAIVKNRVLTKIRFRPCYKSKITGLVSGGEDDGFCREAEDNGFSIVAVPLFAKHMRYPTLKTKLENGCLVSEYYYDILNNRTIIQNPTISGILHEFPNSTLYENENCYTLHIRDSEITKQKLKGLSLQIKEYHIDLDKKNWFVIELFKKQKYCYETPILTKPIKMINIM